MLKIIIITVQLIKAILHISYSLTTSKSTPSNSGHLSLGPGGPGSPGGPTGPGNPLYPDGPLDPGFPGLP